ncbi:hypothetical protein EKL99_11120 [Flavobacterium sp. ZB4P23]|uniref:hypothetical protein n=1 Tax=Flavobacterium sp. ZB4P23 TaxID=2497484 RepID=UPI000F828D27|nr:hypothetical protein [Flavobacterium sp. ZB4P23]RTY81881.1 hypothetical protein EKL99_11120 [Flavobacterium sp. ZB4P23]
MQDKIPHSPENILSTTDGKDTNPKNQEKTIFDFLQNHTATASMVSKATGIPQKCICRYKRDLEQRGLLFEVERKLCKLTSFKAWYLTTNPDLFPKSNLKKLGNE